jgi:multimeric flavodoxin WrbA
VDEAERNASQVREYILNDTEINLLFITGSHRQNGHTQFLGREAMDAAQSIPKVQTKFFDLSELNINPCQSCEDKNGGRLCFQLVNGAPDYSACPATRDNDDMAEIWKAMLWCDGMIIGSPVYAGSVSGVLKNMIDRAIVGLKTRKYWLTDKVGGAFSVAAHIYGGQEFTIVTIENFFRFTGMIIVPDGSPTEADIERLATTTSPWSSQSVVWDRAHFCGASADPTKGAIKKDLVGISNVRGLGEHVALVTKWVKAGREPVQMKIHRHFAKPPIQEMI